jgi:hypothetical protein
MGLNRRLIQIGCLLAIVLVGSIFIYASFQPRMRLAQPDPGASQFMHLKDRSYCYHDQIYLGKSTADVLLFASSRTGAALDPKLAMSSYETVTGRKREIFLFWTPWPNSEIMYAFFRDYLANNPAPKVALFALTPAVKLNPPVHYVHPLFHSFAPPYLYPDVLSSSEIVHSRLFAVSDFLRLLISHLDINLTRLLVVNVSFSVPEGDNCRLQEDAPENLITDTAQHASFEALLNFELEKVMPDLEPERIGTAEGLLETSAGNVLKTNFAKAAIKEWGDTNSWPAERHFLMEAPSDERSIEYYRRIVALAKAHNVKIGFHFMPDLLSPEPPSGQVSEMAESLGAPISLPPIHLRKVSYHYYWDTNHVDKAFRSAYSAWFASLIDQIEKD